MAKRYESKTIAIHQPNYFPWLGYFHKIWASDLFVFYDNVEHSKRYPTRRTLVRKAAHDESPEWLTIPLRKHSDFALIMDLEIDHRQAWPEKHIQKLKNTYHNAPYYKAYIAKFEEWYASAHEFILLSEWNIYLIKSVMEILEIKKDTIQSSKLFMPEKGSKGNIAIVEALGGAFYLSGSGGYNYQTENEFKEKGIELKQSHFAENFKKTMIGYPFGLSALDTLFFLDNITINKLLKGC